MALADAMSDERLCRAGHGHTPRNGSSEPLAPIASALTNEDDMPQNDEDDEEEPSIGQEDVPLRGFLRSVSHVVREKKRRDAKKRAECAPMFAFD